MVKAIWLKATMCSVSAVACHSVAHAQEVSNAPNSPAGQQERSATTVESDTASTQDLTAASQDIIVTAQRRSQRLQDIPATISALGSEMIAQTGVTSLISIGPRIPGFFAGGFGQSRPQLFIRGIGSRQYDPGSEPSVGVFVDDVYLGEIGSALGTLKDVERIEVLKGPQGTLYGRNAIGGAINVLTKDPTRELSGAVSAGLSTYGGYDLFGVVSGPLSRSTAARLAAWRSYTHGFSENLTTGTHTQGIDNLGGRLKLRWDASANLQIDLLGEISRDRGTGYQGETKGTATNPGTLLLARPGVSYVATSDPFSDYMNIDPTLRRDVQTAVLKATYDTDPVSMTSITSFRHSKLIEGRDLDWSPFDVLQQFTDQRSKQITQEFRLSSNSSGGLSLAGKLNWIVGLFYYRYTATRDERIVTGLDSVVGLATGRSNTNRSFGDYLTESYAAYGQATYSLPANFEVTLGARYTHDRKRVDFVGTTTSPGFPLLAVKFDVPDLGRSWSSFDPKIVLAYKPSAAVNFYGSFSQGFKSGGFQFSPFSAAQAALIFDPEKLKAYEIGAKTKWLGGRLTANVSAFKYDYANLQVSRFVALPAPAAAATLITNAASSNIKGAELDLNYNPVGELRLNTGYAYTHAKFDRYAFNATTDFSNTRMPRAPKHSFNVGLENRFVVSQNSGLTLRGDVSYQSRIYFEPGQGELRYGTTLPLTQQSPYALVNLRVTYDMPDWRFSAYLNNVTDKRYLRTTNTLPGQAQWFYGEPLTAGATVSRNF